MRSVLLNAPAKWPAGVILAKARRKPAAACLAQQVANAAAIARERIPDPRGPYCPIVGFKGCFEDQSSGPRERGPFQRAAQHNGWLIIFDWFDANPSRTYHVRPALQGESRNGDEPSRWTLVCARRLQDGTFEQRITNAPHEAVERWRHAPGGENPARANFECAQPDNGLQSRWTIGRNASGPVILGMERQP